MNLTAARPGSLGPSLALALCLATATAAAQPSADGAWPDDTTPALSVNEGELVFIPAPVDIRPLHADTELRLDAASAATGWVGMRQCYRHLDKIAKTEISYSYREIRNLRVTHSDNIGATRLDAQSLVLTDVTADATICVAADVRILRALGDNRYELQNGPYHRRFFDGYYPYHVSLRINHADSSLQPAAVTPVAQPGFGIVRNSDELEIETWFKGILTIRIEFEAGND